ncbi:cytidylate kinase-like family protein [bacterium]|nr:cytidylate kinase-like family protein [bacterium]
MSIITISRGSYSKGKEVAEKVAKKLGYECVSRRILLEASKEFNIPETKLARALHDSPSFFNRFNYGKEKYTSYIRFALLKHLQSDNVVYHGLAGHFFLQDVPNVLKVRIITDMNIRIVEEMKRENISEDEARKILVKDDAERRKWSLHLYKIDTWDPSLYDLVININRMTIDEAVDIIAETCRKPSFQTTPESQQVFEDNLLSAQIQSMLIEQFPTVTVRAKDGKVFVTCMGSLGQKQVIVEELNSMISGVVKKKDLEIHISPILTPD